MWVWFLGQADPLEREIATHSSTGLGHPMDREAWRATAMGSQRVGHNLAAKQKQLSKMQAICVCIRRIELFLSWLTSFIVSHLWFRMYYFPKSVYLKSSRARIQLQSPCKLQSPCSFCCIIQHLSSCVVYFCIMLTRTTQNIPVLCKMVAIL